MMKNLLVWLNQYLKLNEHHFIRDEKKIICWLKKHNINHYELIKNETYGFVVNVNDIVDLRSKKLKKIPVKFNIVEKDFLCHKNLLISLKGSPEIVKGSFWCSDNQLISLEYAPKVVGSDFLCRNNKLLSLEGSPQKVLTFDCSQNHVMSLKGAPLMVENFFCKKNNLTSLEGCPQEVDGMFVCSHNKLKNLYFCPKYVRQFFICNDNPELGEIQNIDNFNQIFLIHKEHLFNIYRKMINEKVNKVQVVTKKNSFKI